jgi:RNA-directed DNA polymerase
VKDRRPEQTPSAVPERAPQDGEIRARWAWVESVVWTERMLATLETGIEGGKWFRLIDKVWSPKNLELSLEKVVAKGGSAGIDKQSARQIEVHKDQYQPQAVKRVWIPKAGSKEKRPLGVPTLRDRIVQGALLQVIEPIFERDFAPQSYGFRPGKGCKEALRRVDELLKGGHHWVVDADLKSYFDTIPQGKLMERIREKIADGRVLDLVEQMLHAGVMDSAKGWQPTEQGTPQGAVVSPLLSNIYLDGLDWQMARNGFEMVRYADDFIVLCRSQEQAQEALEQVRRWVEENGLTLHPSKTRLVDVSRAGGFDFLVYHFERGMKWPRKKSMDKLKDTIRSKTRRTDGRSLRAICEDLSRTLRGWYEYFKHSKANVFGPIDAYTRSRLRCILRKRRKKKGRGRGTDHQRWPNAYFTAAGLFSLKQVHAVDCRSS